MSSMPTAKAIPLRRQGRRGTWPWWRLRELYNSTSCLPAGSRRLL